MRQERLELIMSNVDFGDNDSLDPEDKLFKLRPLFLLLSSKFRQQFVNVPEQFLYCNDSMIQYFKSNHMKQ